MQQLLLLLQTPSLSNNVRDHSHLPFWSPLGNLLGPSWGSLAAVLAPSRAVLVPSWAVLDPSGTVFEPFGGPLGQSLDDL